MIGKLKRLENGKIRIDWSDWSDCETGQSGQTGQTGQTGETGETDKTGVIGREGVTGIDLKCPVHIQTHKVTSPHNNKPDQTKININGFDMAISAAQLLYGPVLVSCLLSQ